MTTDLDQLRAVVELARRYVDADAALAVHAEENVEHSLLYDDWTAASAALVLGVRAFDGGDNPLTAAIVEHRRRAMLANRAADAAAEAVGAMAGKLSELIAEVAGWRQENDRHRALYVDAVKERDRLRVVVNAALRGLGQLGEDVCHDDVLAVADLYADITRQLDGNGHAYEPGGPNGDCHICTLGPDEHDRSLEVGGLDGSGATTETPPAQRILADYARDLQAERDRLRAVVDAVRVMWDNIVGTEDEAVMGFPIADYNAIEEALDALDGSEVMGDDDDRGLANRAEWARNNELPNAIERCPNCGAGPEGNEDCPLCRALDESYEAFAMDAESYEVPVDPATTNPDKREVRRRETTNSGVVPPVHGREDRSTPHTPAAGTDTAKGAQVDDSSSGVPLRPAAEIWHLINRLADDEPGIDGNVIRGWLDTTVREGLQGYLGGAEIYGWGVWHRDDEEWIGFAPTNGLAAELIPDAPGYEHLLLRPAVAYIGVNEPEGEEEIGD